MFKLKKKVNPHVESLERRIKANEEYLETMVAGTKEYKDIQDAINSDYAELRKMTEPKIKVETVIAAVGAFATVAGVITNVIISERRDNTRKEIAQLAYQKEELESELKNGTIMSLAMKE